MRFSSDIAFLQMIAVLCYFSGGLISGTPARDFQPSDNPVAASTKFRMRRASVDSLVRTEENSLLVAHNRLRRAENLGPLVWDSELDEWAKWVISCNADYPGPSNTYTNFDRFDPNMPVTEVVNAWAREGRDTNIKLEKGCRTPSDRTPCNHYTNMIQSDLRRMACAASQCGNMRQLVCIYSISIVRQ